MLVKFSVTFNLSTYGSTLRSGSTPPPKDLLVVRFFFLLCLGELPHPSSYSGSTTNKKVYVIPKRIFKLKLLMKMISDNFSK